MSLQRELLDTLAALEAVKADKKEAMKGYRDEIAVLRKKVKALRGEMASQCTPISDFVPKGAA